MLCRCMVNTWEVVSDKNLEALSCNVHCRFGGQEHSQDNINTARCLQRQRTGQCKTGIKMVRHHPPCVYHLMSSHLTRSPSPSPSIFVKCKQSNTGGGTAWEQDYFYQTIITHRIAPQHQSAGRSHECPRLSVIIIHSF